MSLYQQYPVEIDENSEFAQAVKQGAAVITVPGPNMQHGVPEGKRRLVAVMNGNFFYGPSLATISKPVAPPFEDASGSVPEVSKDRPADDTRPVFP